MATHVINLNIVVGQESFASAATVTDVAGKSVDETLAPSANNVEVDIVLTRAQIKSLVITSAGDCTIKTNSTGSPGDTVAMVAGQEIAWSSVAVVGANPFATADVTKLFLSSTAGGLFKLRAVVSATNG